MDHMGETDAHNQISSLMLLKHSKFIYHRNKQNDKIVMDGSTITPHPLNPANPVCRVRASSQDKL